MSLLNTKVGELVSSDYRIAHIFARHQIDFCCGGGVTLEKAIETSKAKKEILIQEIEQLQNKKLETKSVEEMSLTERTYHVEKVHHKYIRETGPLLQTYSQRMLIAHGESHSEIKPFYNLVSSLLKKLGTHIDNEEKVLFPIIWSLDSKDFSNPMGPHIQDSIQAMKREHSEIESIIKDLKELTNNFQVPEHACKTWTVCYLTLSEFVNDLHTHLNFETEKIFKSYNE